MLLVQETTQRGHEQLGNLVDWISEAQAR
uniref:Uncharacterized protein n=1 Tax=Arundo donax TaxID=35708 RepID=A0A0A9AHD7_ARUDO